MCVWVLHTSSLTSPLPVDPGVFVLYRFDLCSILAECLTSIMNLMKHSPPTIILVNSRGPFTTAWSRVVWRLHWFWISIRRLRNCISHGAVAMHHTCMHSAGWCIQYETKRNNLPAQIWFYQFYGKLIKERKGRNQSVRALTKIRCEWMYECMTSCQATYENSFPPPWCQIIIMTKYHNILNVQ